MEHVVFPFNNFFVDFYLETKENLNTFLSTKKAEKYCKERSDFTQNFIDNIDELIKSKMTDIDLIIKQVKQLKQNELVQKNEQPAIIEIKQESFLFLGLTQLLINKYWLRIKNLDNEKNLSKLLEDINTMEEDVKKISNDYPEASQFFFREIKYIKKL